MLLLLRRLLLRVLRLLLRLLLHRLLLRLLVGERCCVCAAVPWRDVRSGLSWLLLGLTLHEC